MSGGYNEYGYGANQEWGLWGKMSTGYCRLDGRHVGAIFLDVVEQVATSLSPLHNCH